MTPERKLELQREFGLDHDYVLCQIYAVHFAIMDRLSAMDRKIDLALDRLAPVPVVSPAIEQKRQQFNDEEGAEILRWTEISREDAIFARLTFCAQPNPRYHKTAAIRQSNYVADVSFLAGVIEELRQQLEALNKPVVSEHIKKQTAVNP